MREQIKLKKIEINYKRNWKQQKLQNKKIKKKREKNGNFFQKLEKMKYRKKN